MSRQLQTPAQIIFKKRWMCQVQYMHTLSDAKLNIFGISSTGNREHDEAALKQWVRIQLTIADMVEMFSQGIPIIIDNPLQTVNIYETVKEHLSNWHNHVTYNINVGKVPIDDLRKMDLFAASIFNVASKFKKPEELKISKGIQDMLGIGPKVFKVISAIDDPRPLNKQAAPIEKHTPLANIIAKQFSEKTNR